MILRSARVAVVAVAVAILAGCSFSFGGPDYGKLESQITDELNKSYEPLNQKVSSVECPKQDPTPKKGSTFNCTAEVDGEKVRIEVKVTSDDYNVEYTTLDILFDLPDTAGKLADEITKQVGFDVTVDCGEGIKVVESGDTFECTATDPNGEQKTVEVTAGKVGEGEKWKLVD